MAESILNGKRILAVDDEPDVLAILKRKSLDMPQTAKSEKPPTIRRPLRT